MSTAVRFLKQYGVITIFALCAIVSHFMHWTTGEKVVANFYDFGMEMLSFLPFMFILIGLFDVWAPKETIQKNTDDKSGVKGAVLVILLAMLQGGPLYGAFPVASILWQKGCSIRNIFIYLGAFSSLKIPMLTFEIGFLGLKFTLLRTLISLPVFIVIAEIMAMHLKHQHFEIKQI